MAENWFIEEFIAKAWDAFTQTNPPESADFNVVDIVLVLLLSSTLSVMIAKTYQTTHRSLSYSQSFTQTLVILGTVVSVVILVVGSSIARAFALFGALSIVRFRNAVKETRDLGFVFFVMTVGMAIGTRYYFLGILSTAVVALLIHIMTLTDFGRKQLTEFLLEVEIPSTMDYLEVTPPILKRHLKKYTLITMENIGKEKILLSFVIDFRSPRLNTLKLIMGTIGLQKVEEPKTIDDHSAELVKELMEVNDGLRVSLLQGDQGIEV